MQVVVSVLLGLAVIVYMQRNEINIVWGEYDLEQSDLPNDPDADNETAVLPVVPTTSERKRVARFPRLRRVRSRETTDVNPESPAPQPDSAGSTTQ
jgi:hypothetical protein